MQQKWIELIHNNAYSDYKLNSASISEVNRMEQNSGMTLDQDYLNFLRKINGFELNGMNFYGTKAQDDIFVLDAIGQNKFWKGEIPGLAAYYILGDGDMDFYCYAPDEQKYFIFHKGGLEEITSNMIDRCLLFIQEQGGDVSRYSFDRFVTKNIKIKESFNLVPRRLLEEGLITISRDGKEIKIALTTLGYNKLPK